MFGAKFLLIPVTIFYSINTIISDIPNFDDIYPNRNNRKQYGKYQNVFDYCQIQCNGGNHTACVPEGEQCPTSCEYIGEYIPLTNSQKQSIVDLHNRLRNKVAGGGEPRCKLGGIRIGDMQPLQWNLEAEHIAECLAKKCEYIHDSCRKLRNNMECGQNLALKIATDSTIDNFETFDFWSSIIYNWYDELNNCNYPLKESFSEYSVPANMMAVTQMLWSKTHFIGCAYMKYTKDATDELLLFCNYCPTGNIIGEFIFTKGAMQSECVVDAYYPYLCNLKSHKERRTDRKSIYPQLDNNEDEVEQPAQMEESDARRIVSEIGFVLFVGLKMFVL